MKFAIIIASLAVVIGGYLLVWSLCALAKEADRTMSALSDDDYA
jgi:hypothetical protein